MAASFSIARLEDELSAGFAPGWAVVRHERGQPNTYASRIFFHEQDAAEHAHRLTMQEASRGRRQARTG